MSTATRSRFRASTKFGDTAGQITDSQGFLPRVNQSAGNSGFNLTSGSLASGIAGGGAEARDNDSYRTRASMSYVTGGHHSKIGWDGGYYMQDQTNQMNDSRLFYHYSKPATTCVTAAALETFPCGNTSLQFPERSVQPGAAAGSAERAVLHRRRHGPRPGLVRRALRPGSVDAPAVHVQRRAALRPRGEPVSVRPASAAPNEPYMPVQADGTKRYCTPDSDGVSYHDITPRWGAVWDVFGTGRTSVKWNMGKYNNQAAISGIYSNANPARRTANSLQRGWNDLDGDRIVDCDLMNFANNGECTGFNGPAIDRHRPLRERPARARRGWESDRPRHGAVRTHASRASSRRCRPTAASLGDNLISGWGKRRYEWQIGIGVQHEILPRLSGEVTYNRRLYRNLTVQDQLGLGCDRFDGATDHDTCVRTRCSTTRIRRTTSTP